MGLGYDRRRHIGLETDRQRNNAAVDVYADGHPGANIAGTDHIPVAGIRLRGGKIARGGWRGRIVDRINLHAMAGGVGGGGG